VVNRRYQAPASNGGASSIQPISSGRALYCGSASQGNELVVPLCPNVVGRIELFVELPVAVIAQETIDNLMSIPVGDGEISKLGGNAGNVVAK
jgi:hypothetical protein